MISKYYEFVVDTLDLFDGQLSLGDIYNATQKELYFLRKHRRELKKRSSDAQSKTINKLLK